MAGVLTRSKCPPPRSTGAAEPGARAGARARGEFRQCECLHRQDRRAGGEAHRRHRRRGRRLPREPGLHRLHGRDRRAARRHEVRRRPRAMRGEGETGPVDRGRQGHHDDRHLPESGDPHGDDRWRRSHHQRHRQGRRHDRARHGDDALLRLHGCADRRPGAAGPGEEGRREELQLRHGRRRHLHLGYAPGFRHRRGPGARRADDHASERPAARAVPPGLRGSSRRSRPAGGPRRRGGAEIRDRARDRSQGRLRPAASPCRSPTRLS